LNANISFCTQRNIFKKGLVTGASAPARRPGEDSPADRTRMGLNRSHHETRGRPGPGPGPGLRMFPPSGSSGRREHHGISQKWAENPCRATGRRCSPRRNGRRAALGAAERAGGAGRGGVGREERAVGQGPQVAMSAHAGARGGEGRDSGGGRGSKARRKCGGNRAGENPRRAKSAVDRAGKTLPEIGRQPNLVDRERTVCGVSGGSPGELTDEARRCEG
jgi:hypothetical protein